MSAALRWAVVAVNDDGRTFIVNHGMCYATAEQLAGVMRDLSTDAEIEDGWNYLPRINRTANMATRPRAVSRGVQANQSQAAGSMRRTLRHSGGTTRSGSPASQAAWIMPRLPK